MSSARHQRRGSWRMLGRRCEAESAQAATPAAHVDSSPLRLEGSRLTSVRKKLAAPPTCSALYPRSVKWGPTIECLRWGAGSACHMFK